MEISKEDMFNALTALKAISSDYENECNIFNIQQAVDTSNYIAHFPEDMIEERTSWDQLNYKMTAFQRAFEDIFCELKKLGEKINYDQCSIEIKD